MINSIYSKNISSSAKILDYAIIYENVVIGDNVVIGEHNVIGKLPTPTSNICRNLDLNLTKKPLLFRALSIIMVFVKNFDLLVYFEGLI